VAVPVGDLDVDLVGAEVDAAPLERDDLADAHARITGEQHEHQRSRIARRRRTSVP
jgi:hypothetical protein